MNKKKSQNGMSIVLCGEAGQGIQTIEQLLDRVFKRSGYHVFSTTEFMSRIRGGANSTEIRISDRPVNAFLTRIDLLISLSATALPHLETRLGPETTVLGDRSNLIGGDRSRRLEIPFSEIAAEIGSSIYVNTVAGGVVAGLLQVEKELLNRELGLILSAKTREVVQKNLRAGEKGYEIGTELLRSRECSFGVAKSESATDRMLVSGTQAVAMGALAGGCNFLSFYPMSPATGVAVFLAQHAGQFGTVVEQAEGEIAAVNMALGAWYAGARAMVTTSGGGFDLMTEGLSLAGILESPLVIHLGQRPGGATGLPTRTEQADLDVALYAGHGEAPRIILAPGTAEDAFYLTRKAFELADRYQTPVIVLTEQCFLDSYYLVDSLDLDESPIEQHIVETEEDYRRYRITEDGVSPRGIPAHGRGLVVASGNEHDEEGHLIEDGVLRTKMVNKRTKKFDSMQSDVEEPRRIGPDRAKKLLVTWGSTYHAMEEVLSRLDREDLACLHFRQVFPLPQSTRHHLTSADELIVVEANRTAQLARLIKAQTGVDIHKRILKYDGRPFSVEEITERVRRTLDKR